MGNRNFLLAGILAAVAIVAVAGYAFAYYPYMNQNNTNNGNQCPTQMMGGNMMGGMMNGGMMGMGSHMGGMQCPYHQNGNYNSTNGIAIASYGFHPNAYTVKVGTTVTWINMDNVAHTITSDTGLFDSGLLNHMQSYSYTFTTAGTYTYHCTPHPSMTGTIIVEA